MKKLEIFNQYSRKDVHDIFSPETSFQPSTGSWGLHGIIKTPNSQPEYIFFVSYGQHQGDHVFDEGITEEGVLTWQSQPRHKLNSLLIQDFINQDELDIKIHLFLRTRKSGLYTYFGLLEYLTHDNQRENPVYFQWQIKNWKINEAVNRKIGLELIPTQIKPPYKEAKQNKSTLIFEESPAIYEKIKKSGTPTEEFKVKKNPNYLELDSKNKKLGLLGEKLVIKQEKEKLIKRGYQELADKIIHVSEEIGDHVGYDIKSFDENGKEIFIEVKTTRGYKNTPFFLSANELKICIKEPRKYHLYRVYYYSEKDDTGYCYIMTGNISEKLILEPINYKASF